MASVHPTTWRARTVSVFRTRPVFGGNSGGGGKKLREVQRSSLRPLRTGQSQRRDVCM